MFISRWVPGEPASRTAFVGATDTLRWVALYNSKISDAYRSPIDAKRVPSVWASGLHDGDDFEMPLAAGSIDNVTAIRAVSPFAIVMCPRGPAPQRGEGAWDG